MGTASSVENSRIPETAYGTVLVLSQFMLFALFGFSGISRAEIALPSYLSFVISASVSAMLWYGKAVPSRWKTYVVFSTVLVLLVFPYYALRFTSASAAAVPFFVVALYATTIFLGVCSLNTRIGFGVVYFGVLSLLQRGNPLMSVDALLMVLAASIVLHLLRWRVLPPSLTRMKGEHNSEQHRTMALDRAWQCLYLQGSVLLLLLFTDVVRSADTAVPIQLKLLGLASLIVSAYLMLGVRRENVELRMIVSTLLVGTVVSLSTLWDDGQYSLYAALPTLYVLGLTSVFYWSIHRYVFIVGWLVATDVALRLGLSLTGYNRAAIISVSLGGVLAILVSRLRQSLDDRSGTSAGAIELPPERMQQLDQGLQDQLLSCQLRSVVVWQQCYAGAAILFSSYVISQHAPALFWFVLLGVGVLLALFAAIHHFVATQRRLGIAWMLVFCAFTCSSLWSGVPILYFEASNLFYLYWVVTITLGIAICPWRLVELLTIASIALMVLVESMESLGFTHEKIYAAFVLLAASVVIARSIETSLREKLLVRIGFEYISEAERPEDAELRLIEILMLYTGAQWALYQGVRAMPMWLVDKNHAIDTSLWEAMLRDASKYTRESISVGPEITFHRLATNSPRDEGVGSSLSSLREYALLVTISLTVASENREIRCLFSRPMPFWGLTRVCVAASSVLAFSRVTLQQQLDSAFTQAFRESIADRDAMREFELSAMVHDINNTVQDLTLLCSSIREAVDVTASAEAVTNSVSSEVELIEATARSIAHIVSDAKRRRELEQLEDLAPREIVSVHEVIAEVVVFARLRAERKGIQIHEELRLETEAFVKISVREHLDAVLRNILQNAVSYSSKGGTVHVRVLSHAAMLRIEVEDSGVGLTAEDLRHLFTPGYRGRMRNTVFGGLGLGLAQSRRVIEAAGGTLECFSDGPGTGALFRVELPRIDTAEMGEQTAWALLVDDEPRLISYYERLVTACGLQPRSASSFDGARAILDQCGKPTLVITDLQIGVDSGEQVIEEVRDRFGQIVPILVITGIRDSNRTNGARQAGATEVIHKPVGQRALFARIESTIPMQRESRSREQSREEREE